MSSQRKKINLIVENSCRFCPYMGYEPSYGMTGFGYDCDHENMKWELRRIISSDGDDLDIPEEEWPPIPDSCPLEDADE